MVLQTYWIFMYNANNVDQQENRENQLNQTSAGPVDQLLFNP